MRSGSFGLCSGGEAVIASVANVLVFVYRFRTDLGGVGSGLRMCNTGAGISARALVRSGFERLTGRSLRGRSMRCKRVSKTGERERVTEMEVQDGSIGMRVRGVRSRDRTLIFFLSRSQQEVDGRVWAGQCRGYKRAAAPFSLFFFDVAGSMTIVMMSSSVVKCCFPPCSELRAPDVLRGTCITAAYHRSHLPCPLSRAQPVHGRKPDTRTPGRSSFALQPPKTSSEFI